MRDLGLDATYGALWNDAPAAAFASVNTMSLFGLHRRWRGAALGHLAAVEMTSSEPSRRYSAGLRRLGFDERATVFYDEHVEADAVHEQIASVDMCGSLVADEPRPAARRPVRRGLLAGHGRRRRRSTCSAPGRPAARRCAGERRWPPDRALPPRRISGTDRLRYGWIRHPQCRRQPRSSRRRAIGWARRTCGGRTAPSTRRQRAGDPHDVEALERVIEALDADVDLRARRPPADPALARRRRSASPTAPPGCRRTAASRSGRPRASSRRPWPPPGTPQDAMTERRRLRRRGAGAPAGRC